MNLRMSAGKRASCSLVITTAVSVASLVASEAFAQSCKYLFTGSADAGANSSTVSQFKSAMEAGDPLFVSFKFHGYSKNPPELGRIQNLIKDDSGDITDFVWMDKVGKLTRHSISEVDPVSINYVHVPPKKMSVNEFHSLTLLMPASRYGRYISFRAKSLSTEQVNTYEGWVLDVVLNAEGQHVVYLNRGDETPEEQPSVPLRQAMFANAEVVRLTDIITDSIQDVSINTLDFGRFNLHRFLPFTEKGAHLTAYVGQVGRNDGAKISISSRFYDHLSIFADPNRASGFRLPRDIEAMSRGTELRLYFASNRSKIRLTIRHYPSGDWAIADTSFDLQKVNESYSTTGWNGWPSRYSVSEESQLKSRSRTLPASELRYHLQMIRNTLMYEAVQTQFHHVVEEWAKAIPENAASAEVAELILRDQGLTFDLRNGVVAEKKRDLHEVEIKKLATIKYLLDHRLVFYSNNANVSQIPEGIYPRGLHKIKNLRPTEYDFGTALFRAMKRAGYGYADGHWWPHKPSKRTSH